MGPNMAHRQGPCARVIGVAEATRLVGMAGVRSGAIRKRAWNLRQQALEDRSPPRHRLRAYEPGGIGRLPAAELLFHIIEQEPQTFGGARGWCHCRY